MHMADDATMPRSKEPLPGVPIACPLCLDHTVEQVEGIVLSAQPIGGREISKVSVYRCSFWHLFAVFEQPTAWE
jgi:hypothetical protein